MQGSLVLNALTDPMATLTGHAIAMPIAMVMLAVAWRPLVAQAR